MLMCPPNIKTTLPPPPPTLPSRLLPRRRLTIPNPPKKNPSINLLSPLHSPAPPQLQPRHLDSTFGTAASSTTAHRAILRLTLSQHAGCRIPQRRGLICLS